MVGGNVPAARAEANRFRRAAFFKDLPAPTVPGQDSRPMAQASRLLVLFGCTGLALAAPPAETARLAAEVRPLGWVAYSARSPKGDWEIYAMRPDGTDVRNLTNSPTRRISTRSFPAMVANCSSARCPAARP